MTSDVCITNKKFFDNKMSNYIRLLFAIKLAELHEKHLVKFLAEKPMGPVLHEVLVEVLRNLCKIILETENIPADLLDLNFNDADIILVVPNIGPNLLELIDELIPRAKHDVLLELTNCVKKELHYLLSRDKLGLGNK